MPLYLITRDGVRVCHRRSASPDIAISEQLHEEYFGRLTCMATDVVIAPRAAERTVVISKRGAATYLAVLDDDL